MSPSKTARTLITLGALSALFWSPALAALRSIAGYQPIRAYRADLPQRILEWRGLHNRAGAGRLSLAGHADGCVSLRRSSSGAIAVCHELASTEVGALLPARDGTLWIGTLDGLVSWKNGQLTEHPTLGRRRVNALLQDRDGTVWAGTASGGSAGRLCAIRSDSTQCYGDDGSLGASVQSLYEDSDGSLWVGAANGLWRWKPGPPIRYLATPILERQTLAQGDHQSGLIVADGQRPSTHRHKRHGLPSSWPAVVFEGHTAPPRPGRRPVDRHTRLVDLCTRTRAKHPRLLIKTACRAIW